MQETLITNLRARELMASGDSRRPTVQDRGTIFVLGARWYAGKFEVLGLAQGG